MVVMTVLFRKSMYPYSYIHNYTYQDKPLFIDTIDLMFSPLRTIFEGKNVDLLSGKEAIPAKSWMNSPYMKIATIISIIAMTVVFPIIGSAFTIGLALKAGCCVWEKKKVTSEIEHIFKVLTTFQNNYDSKEYVKALSALETRPQLGARCRKELLDIANVFSQSEDTFPLLPKLYQLYSVDNDSINLFRQIIETKFKQDMIGFDLKHIEEWIKNLELSDKETFIYCISIIDLFKPEDDDPFLVKMAKLNAGFGIIKIFAEYKQNLHRVELVEPILYSQNFFANPFYFQRMQPKKLENFNTELVRGSLLDSIHKNKIIYTQFLNSDSDRQHLSYLISAIRKVKKLEDDINQILPQLDEKHFNPKNPVENLKYKKKIITHAMLFLDRIGTLCYTDAKKRKRLPVLSKQLISFIQSKRKNIDSNYEYYAEALKLAGELLTESENNLKFNNVKFELSVLRIKQKIYGEVGELYFPADNPINDLYREYYLTFRSQFDFIDRVLTLVSHIENLNIEEKQGGSYN